MAIAGILFDKDGTLIDFEKSWTPVIQQLSLTAAGGDKELAARLMTVGGMDIESGKVIADSLFAAGNTVEIAEAFATEGAVIPYEQMVVDMDDFFAGAYEFAVPVTDLASFFARLKARGLKLGIASSDNERAIRGLSRHLGFEQYLDYVCGYDSGHGAKPEPGMALGFCDATGLAPGEVMMVGDNAHDMEMARRAALGMRVGVLTGTGNAASLGAIAHHVVDDITRLENLL